MKHIQYEDLRPYYDRASEFDDKTILARLVEKQKLSDFMRRGRIPRFRRETNRRRTQE